MLKEFREFLNRGNVIDLAVAVVIGTAFKAIVDSLVNDLIMPFIGLIMGGIDFTNLVFQVGEAMIAYGNFLQAVVNFLLISFALFFIVRAFNQMQKKQEAQQPEPTPSPEEILLTEIRDLLKEK